MSDLAADTVHAPGFPAPRFSGPAGRVPSGANPARTSRTEFRIYFALILAVAVPVAVLGWCTRLALTRRMPEQNALSRAWCDARGITPLIFRP